MIKLFILAMVLLASCSTIEKNIYVSTDGDVDIEYRTKSRTKIEAKEVGKAIIPLPF